MQAAFGDCNSTCPKRVSAANAARSRDYDDADHSWRVRARHRQCLRARRRCTRVLLVGGLPGSSQGIKSRPVQPAVKPETISIHSASTRPHSDPHAGGAFNELLRHDESRVEQTNKLRPGWDASGRNGGSWGRGGARTAHLHGRFLLADARTKEILEKAAVLSGVPLFCANN